MKKLVTVFLSLVLMLAVCASANAAISLPTSADQGVGASLNHGLSSSTLPVIEKVEAAGDHLSITFDKTTVPEDNGVYVYFMDDDGDWYYDAPHYSIDENGVALINIPEGYTNVAEIGFSGDLPTDLGYKSYTSVYHGDGSLNYYTFEYNQYKSGFSENIHLEYNDKNQLIYEFYSLHENGISNSYNARFYAGSGKLRSYSIDTCLEDGSYLHSEYDQFGRITYLNWWDENGDYYWSNGQWYDYMDDNKIDFTPFDVTTLKAPYAEEFVIVAPPTKVENIDLTLGDLTSDEYGYHYNSGAVSAWYDKNGNLTDYNYTSFDNTTREEFFYAKNGNVVSHRVVSLANDEYNLKSEIEFYANSGAPKNYFYVTEDNVNVFCSADGTVTSLFFCDANDNQYYWDDYNGWSACDLVGNDIEVDVSAMPDPQSFKGPVLVSVTPVTKDDVKVAPTAAAGAPTLPVALAELPSITSAVLENNKLSVSVSDELDEMSFSNDDDFQNVYLYVNYKQDGKWVWSDTLSNDVITFALESDPVFYYNTETKTYEFELPEDVEDLKYGIYVDRIIDNMSYYYSITEDGVNVSVYNEYLGDVSQSFYYEEGKLVEVYTSLDDYYLTSYYDEEGNLESYRYPVAENNHASFLPDGTLDYIRYYDSENKKSIFWDAVNGWHTREYSDVDESFVPTTVEKPAEAVDPEDVKPIFVISKKPEHIWFPKNTLGLAAVSMKDLGISSDWHNVAPVDLTTEGTTVFTLVGADAWILGQAYVTVADGNVTVDYAILDGHGYMKSEKLNWFLSKADLTEENLKAESNYAFGEPVSIADQLGGAETAILFIDSKITFRQPYFDAYNYSTRYYRNRENWKEYREGLIEMIK